MYRVFSVGLVLCLLLVGEVRSQSASEVSISAGATPSEVGTAETVTFEIQVKGASLSAIETPEPPTTTNLVLQEPTPTTRRELSFNSGHLSRRITFAWTYRPMQVGIGRIRPVTVRIQDKRYTTGEVRVRIVPQSQRSPAPPRPHAGATPPSRSAGPDDQTALGPRDLFIRATASAETAYQNEQLTAEYRLFFRPGVQLRKSRMADAWDAPGFWREELDVAPRPTPQPTTMYGETYKSIVLKRVALFPTRAGTLRVDPLRIETEAQARMQMGRRNGTTVQSYYEPVTLTSQELSVVAEDLPAKSPRAFDGAVGQFALDTEVSTDSVEVGQAVEMTVRIDGAGNLATVSPPVVNPPADVELYEPAVDTEIDRSGERVQGTKTFTYTLVPRSNGRYTLSPVTFSYFDPEAEAYQTRRSDPVTLQVTGDVPPQAVSQTGEGLPVGDIAGPMGNDVHWVRPDRAPLHRQPWAYVVVLLPLVLAAGGVAYRRLAGGLPAAPVDDRSDGLDEAQRHLSDAHHHLRDEARDAFYQTVERAVLTFLVTRLDLDRAPSSLTRNVLDRHLDRQNVPDADREALHELLDVCDEAQFTPAEPSHDAMEAALDHAQTLLLRLDEALPARSQHAST